MFQVGCELAGMLSAETDAEIIALSIKCLGKVGIKKPGLGYRAQRAFGITAKPDG